MREFKEGYKGYKSYRGDKFLGLKAIFHVKNYFSSLEFNYDK